jgi:hypothetical protein
MGFEVPFHISFHKCETGGCDKVELMLLLHMFN